MAHSSFLIGHSGERSSSGHFRRGVAREWVRTMSPEKAVACGDFPNGVHYLGKVEEFLQL